MKLGKELKRIPHKYGHICVGFFSTPSPTSVPTSGFSFSSIQIVEGNVCNTLGIIKVDLVGSLELHLMLHQEITLVYICRIRIRLYVIKSLNDIYMSNNF